MGEQARLGLDDVVTVGSGRDRRRGEKVNPDVNTKSRLRGTPGGEVMEKNVALQKFD